MILCCGEALIDFVPIPEAGAYRPCPGGSIFNVAVGLGRLEVPAGFFSKVSDDFFGDQLIAYLQENGVETHHCIRTANPTTLAFVSLESGEDAEPRYSFFTNESADRSLMVEEIPSHLPEEVKVLHFGSISLVMEPGATALETLMTRENSRCIISLDPNVRPILIPDREAFQNRFEGWLGFVDILKLSQADWKWIYPNTNFDLLLEHWFQQGVSLVIETRGAEGVAAHTAGGTQAFVKTPKVEVADTVGAGDTLMAASLAFLYRSGWMEIKRLRGLSAEQLQPCLSYAAKAAAINCTRTGADPPTRSEMETSYA